MVNKYIPKYILIGEIDKMASKEETLLLNLMETGTVSEIKHGKTRNGAGEDSVFATINK